MSTIGITGGTGFVGQHVATLLRKRGDEVVIFTRHMPKERPLERTRYALWDADKGTCDTEAMSTLDGVIHLAGAGIADKRLTDKRKREIVDSRVMGTNFLVAQLRAHAPKCKGMVSASATGFYGADEDGSIPFKETAKPAKDFLGDTCRQWEAASQTASDFLDTAILRFGIVLGKESGAFPQFVQPMGFGVMPILGSGRQVVSWIEVDDLARLILFALDNKLRGIYNAVAPNPVTHKQLMQTIAKEKGGLKIPVPVPAFLLKIALGELSEEVLKSCTVSAQKTLATGFSFNYPEIDSAVKAILR